MSPTVSAEFASNAYLAVGSRMGFLNRYPVLHSEDSTRSSIIHQSLLKTYGNLSTGITSICHDNKGIFIAYASDQQRNALRIIHNPSGQVVSNWPVETINLGRVTSVAFAPRSSTLAVGNRSGRVQLFGILTC
uniref:Uncharacterized protein n=2 Tax=Babesia bovis TaxID=5865 RepID=A7AQ71_BABBO|eukprot:XP_001612273.1 hypothetical protein [Babesia bovis T2Bo]